MNSHWMKLPLLLVIGWSATAFAASITEMSEQAKEMVEEIQSISREVDALAVEAKQSNDSVLIQCVSTKQTSVSALKDISVGALPGILQATTTEKAEFEFRKINVSLPRVHQFYNEAQKCVTGESSTSEGGTSETQVISVAGSGPTTVVPKSVAKIQKIETAMGECSDGINTTVRKNLSQVTTCHDISLKSNPSVAGRVEIEVVIEGGTVTGTSLVKNSTGDKKVETCIEKKIVKWKFPSSCSDIAVLPFALSPESLQATTTEMAEFQFQAIGTVGEGAADVDLDKVLDGVTDGQMAVSDAQMTVKGQMDKSGKATTKVGVESVVKVQKIETAMGECSDGINTTVRKNLSQVTTCHDISLKSNPSVAGRVEIEVVIEGGTVTGTSLVKNSTGDKKVGSCIEKKIVKWKVPSSCSDIAVLPFALSPKN